MSRRRTGFCLRFGPLFAVSILVGICGSHASAQTAVTTYHYDNNRTGWNPAETVLTPANVTASTFGLLYSVPLDDQVDAQPLFVPGVNITAGNFQGVHDVVYVVTENNSVYAIDSHTGTVLLNPNFGTPVSVPLGCDENGPHVGDTSTPVIDTTSNTLYAIFLTVSANVHAYYIHALDLGSLTDKVTPQMVSASHKVTNGKTFLFNAMYQRQRPGLLLANGNIYAGFGSFCDLKANVSRGWVLGWTTGSLTPLAANLLVDTQATAPHNFYLSSVWMSGYGLAADDSGNILLVTGNSDPSGTTYDGVTNFQESVIKLSPDLTTVLSLFTPMNQSLLDMHDLDFGAGGVLVLPDQAGSIPHLAVAAGKDGNMYLMNEDSLGGFSSTQNNVLGTYAIGGCWCGQSYYMDSGGPRVVSSGGITVILWKLQTSPTPSLTQVIASASLHSGQNAGFFTSISSNGTADPIIWAVSRPNQTNFEIYLNAFNPDASAVQTMKSIYRAAAGTWPVHEANANLVPVVANGQVYIASSQVLQVFGLTSGKRR
jgi:hypothetical protein